MKPTARRRKGRPERIRVSLFDDSTDVGHYGGFMAGHFLFVYYLFVR